MSVPAMLSLIVVEGEDRNQLLCRNHSGWAGKLQRLEGTRMRARDVVRNCDLVVTQRIRSQHRSGSLDQLQNAGIDQPSCAAMLCEVEERTAGPAIAIDYAFR
jgi:hypothetical protein